MAADPAPPKPTFWQRQVVRSLAKAAKKRPGEPLSPEDWAVFFDVAGRPGHRIKRFMTALPSSPRCGFCGAPFAGPGSRVLRPLGYRPSRKNPTMCDVCVEAAPPGGMTTEAGVLFADLRGFTSLAERSSPQEVSALLRRFYTSAENVLFPEAIIDKVMGDAVMALYLPSYMSVEGREEVAAVMIEHARRLLGEVGPFAEVGIGLDYGEAFVGNIGDGSVRDFTAIGDVVNTASRLQGHARGGEIVLSARLAEGLDAPPGEPAELVVKGKELPVATRRIAV